jgi:integrase
MRTNSVTCSVAAYVAWITAAGIDTGRVFRRVNRHSHLGLKLSTNAVAEIVQRRAALAGLDAKSFSGHSMRSGFATTAAAAGIEERVIMRQTRYRSIAAVRRYIQEGELFARNLAMEIGL